MTDINEELVETIFANKDENVREIYCELLKILSSFGEYKIEAKKTSIHIVKESAFLGINPNKKWMDINIVSTKPIKHKKITKVEQVSKNRFHNNLRIKEKQELDASVVNLCKEAYLIIDKNKKGCL